MLTSQPMAFGQLLRRHRLDAGLTQEALAGRAGLSMHGVQKLERGVTRPYPDSVRRLAAALRLSREDERTFREAAPAPRQRPIPAMSSLAERARHGLRIPLTSFVGREREMAELKRLLARARLVTLTGPPGTGKTRLATELAAALDDTYADGIYFVPLAPLRDPNLVVPTVAQALAVREAPDRPLLQVLADHIQGKHLLLVLDNFEHVLPAGPALADLLGRCPQLSILVTSRALLRLQGEQTFAVPPLTLPVRHQGGLVEDATGYEAVRLFMERAQAVKPEFTLSEQNAPAVVAICQRLDGLPLAIELAAAHVRLFPPRTLLVRLQQRLPLLTDGARDLPARQQTLRGAIAWSYDLLQPGEQLLFRRLGVFVGSGTLEAALDVLARLGIKDPELGPLAAGASACDGERNRPDGHKPAMSSACAPNATTTILGGLAALVDQNLLRLEDRADGEVRFLMLETIREYALEQLTAQAEAEPARRAHAAYYLALAEQSHAERNGPRQGTWLDLLERDLDNLRAALAWSTSEVNDDTGPRIAAALWPFWARRGHAMEGRAWLAKALVATQATDPCGRGKDTRAKALAAAGAVAIRQGDYVAARAYYEESLALRRELADAWGIAEALNGVAHALLMQGELDLATALAEESLTLSGQHGDPQLIYRALHPLAEVALARGADGRAAALFQEALGLQRQRGDANGVVRSLCGLADVARRKREYAEAATLLEEAVAIAQALRDPGSMVAALRRQGLVAMDRGDRIAARDRLHGGLALERQVGTTRETARAMEGLATLAAAEGQAERALRLAGAAASLRGAWHTPAPPIEQADLEGRLAPARQALSAEAAAAAWTKGQAMQRELAIAYALEEDSAPAL